MATIQIADDDARVQYTQAVVANTTQLTIDYPFFSLDDINVIVTNAAGTDTILTRGTGTGTFAVVGVAVDDGFSGGYITLGDSYSSGTDVFTLFRDIPVERTTDFPTSGPFNISSLNTELDKIIAIEQELETKVTRTLQLADSDATVDLKLPNLDTRKGTTLAFNATTGIPEAGPTISGVNTVAALAADIATLADIEDGTVATDAISDTAAIAANVTTVAGISSNVTTVSGNTSNINTVAGNTTNINTVAGNNANVTTVAGISGNVTTVAGISADVTAVAGDATDIGTVSANISNVNTVAGISADVTTVAADGTDIGVVAGISSDVTTVSGIAANVTSVAGNAANINTVAADATDIGTVATNIANVNTAAGISANITTVAGIASDVTAAATNASDISAIAAEVAKVVTVANDLNEATSEIDTVANSIANVDLVGGSIANVNTVATNLTNVNAFADTYFISATAPASPTLGDLWFDTTNNIMKVYGSGGFVNAGSSVNGTANRYAWTVGTASGTYTGSTTVFPATYDAGYADVFLNGVKLLVGTDVTATNGTDVTLATAAAANDIVEIVAYGTFTAATALSLGDNEKIQLGASQDLQIYHSGTHSFIDDAGTGNLYIRSSDMRLQKYTGENLIVATADAGVTLYHDNNAAKLATTATGVDVSSTDATVNFVSSRGTGATHTITTGGANSLNFNINAASSGDIYVNAENKIFRNAAGSTEHMRIDGATGNVGIGSVSPQKKFVVSNAGAAGLEIDPTNRSGGVGTALLSYNRSGSAYVRADYDASEHLMWVNGTIKARFTANGLTFNGDTAAANALDDYEEGSWNPAYTASTSGTPTTTISAGYYIKVGRLVTASLYIAGAANGASGNLYISGLPYTGVSLATGYGTGHSAIYGQAWGWSNVPASVYVPFGGNFAALWAPSTGYHTVSDMGGSSNAMSISFTYITS